MASDLTTLVDRLKTYSELPLEEIRTLDPAHYTSPVLYELELEHIWKKEWVVVGHVSEVKNPGDFFAFDLNDEPMMVVRGEDMQVRALTTVCRHRFMPIVKHGERGNTSRFQCPYHRWTYGLEGQLNQALYMEENRSFGNGLIFVNLDDDAEPLAPRLVDIEEDFRRATGSDGPELVNPYPYDEIWAANWKLCMENNEAYHTMGVHSDTLEPYVPTKNIQPATHGEYWTKSRDLYATERGVTQRILKRYGWKPGVMGQEEPCLALYIIPPANGFSISPEGVVFQGQWPVAIDHTRSWAGYLERPETVRPVDDPKDSYFHIVQNQDKSAFAAGLGFGVYSGKLDAGPLSWMEEQVMRTHQWTARKLLEAVG